MSGLRGIASTKTAGQNSGDKLRHKRHFLCSPVVGVDHNYIRPHQGLDGKTSVEACGIEIKGENKGITLIQKRVRGRKRNMSHKVFKARISRNNASLEIRVHFAEPISLFRFYHWNKSCYIVQSN